MSKMSELSLAVAELYKCGEVLIGISDDANAPVHKQPKEKVATKTKKQEAKQVCK